MKTQNVEFIEALKILAADTGVELPKDSRRVEPSKRAAQDAAMLEALSFFKSHLERNKDAKEYCERRGLDESARQTWELGYAPHEGSALATQLKKKGHLLTECRSLFLVEEDSGGGYFDRFRGRLMFPIRDERGDLVAFGGRILGDGHPKYVNSGDTPLFHKSRVLYGMCRAKESIAKERKAVLTEGYLDVIACHQAGVVNAIASLGTALTEDHAKILKRWCDGVIVLYDSDSAGQKAAERAIEVLEPAGLKVRIVLLPQGEDPDTMLRRDGPGALKRAIEKLLTPTEYRLELLKKRVSMEQEDFWTEAVRLIAASPTDREMEMLIMQLAPMHPQLRDAIVAQSSLRADILTTRKRLRQSTNSARPDRLIADRWSSSGSASSHSQGSGPTANPFSPAEQVVFQSFLVAELRPAALKIMSDPDLFETKAGAALASSVCAIFSESPAGLPSAWLHLLETPAANLFVDLELRMDPKTLDTASLTGAAERLKRKREKRLYQDLKGSDRDDASLMEINKRLRELNNKTEY